MATAELTGAQLDYWVAKAAGLNPLLTTMIEDLSPVCVVGYTPFLPSTDWALGGPIIEEEQIGIACVGLPPLQWQANVRGSGKFVYGDTPLIAAMRSFVASKFGEEIAD